MSGAIELKFLTGAALTRNDAAEVERAAKPQAREVAELLAAH